MIRDPAGGFQFLYEFKKDLEQIYQDLAKIILTYLKEEDIFYRLY